jgi:flavodoxin I
MKVVIVYDSYFGNTEKVAQAMCRALEPQGEVLMVRAGDAKADLISGSDLLIIGSPTRRFRPSEATTQFLNTLTPEDLKGMKTLAFDTRISLEDINSAVGRFFVRNFGYAAPFISKQLEKKGAKLAAPPEGFDVRASEGPLKDGELDRAADWVKQFC